MAEPAPKTPSTDPATDLRGQLVKRLAVAGVLVAILLGMLAFFDYLATPPEETDSPVFTKPVPVAPKKEVSQPVMPNANLPEPPAAEPETAPTPTPTPTPAPTEPPPPPPQVAPQPTPATEESKPGSKGGAKKEFHATTRSTVTPALPPLPPPPVSRQAATSRPTPVVPEATGEPTLVLRPEPEVPTANRPTARVLEVQRPPAVTPPSLTRLFSGFLLQAGVFSSAKSAEELHAKLTLSGVPSTLETRVQVGPFRTRQEAEAAQEKLKSLGVETILVPPKGAKH